MPSNRNRIIIACAGSGKTKMLVDEAIENRNRRIALVTYTNNNTQEIIRRFGNLNSGVPRHVDVMTWFGFLLRECARPYQHAKYAERRIESLLFVSEQSSLYVGEGNTRAHYFANGELIYSDKIAKFILACEKQSSRAVTTRLSQIYTDIFVDEFQDLAGWDLEIIRLLLESGIRITLVGDPRQHIYSTSPARKNKQYLGANIIDLLNKWEKLGLCSVSYMNETNRCNAPICEFSNALWPGMNPMTSNRVDATDHDGIFLVARKEVPGYLGRFTPQVLRYNKKAEAYGRDALNFGMAKGLQFERVLIVPTESIKKYLQSGTLGYVEKSRDKLHVAVTRAWNSVAFVFDGQSPIISRRWNH